MVGSDPFFVKQNPDFIRILFSQNLRKIAVSLQIKVPA